MKYLPQAIAFDFETCLESGEPTLDMYRKDARIKSAAFAWRGECGSIKTEITWGEEATERFLERCIDAAVPLVCHNWQFELLCITCRYPNLKTPTYHICDTMRMAQMADNGGKQVVVDFQKSFEDILSELKGFAPLSGLSLEACVSRFCGNDRYKHKEPFKKLMVDRGGTSSSFDLLTKEELGEYNALDAIVTLELYEKLLIKLADKDWASDHKLYKYMCELTNTSRVRGVLIDQEVLDEHIRLKKLELIEIEANFREYFKKEIAEIEQEMYEKLVNKYKTDKTKAAVQVPKFNIGSTTQLGKLFVGKLKIKPQFFTKKGAPSFSSKLLSQWGEGGELLKNRGKATIELAQGESLKKLSEYDGRWHVSIKVAGTKTSRMAGG